MSHAVGIGNFSEYVDEPELEQYQTGQAIDDFVRGCFDVRYGCMISFDPEGNPARPWSIVMHQGARFSGGDVRYGEGATFPEAMAAIAECPWGPGMTLEQMQM